MSDLSWVLPLSALMVLVFAVTGWCAGRQRDFTDAIKEHEKQADKLLIDEELRLKIDEFLALPMFEVPGATVRASMLLLFAGIAGNLARHAPDFLVAHPWVAENITESVWRDVLFAALSVLILWSYWHIHKALSKIKKINQDGREILTRLKMVRSRTFASLASTR